MAELEIDGLTKVFGDEDEGEIVAVDELDLAIEDGEFLVLVGPSGCGKSTTLRCVAGLERPTEGEIYLDGAPITHDKPKDRNIAMVFQNYALYPHMTARENMSFGLRMTTDLSDEEIAKRVEGTARMMGIDDLLGQKPAELSGGQQQRVALGRAIVREPKVFLMDEPLSNLDAKLRTTMRTELQELQQNLGTTTMYVTHDQTEAMTMGDRIAVLDGGELQQIGTPLECYHRPENQFVAGFIGSPSMNFLDVHHSDGTLEHAGFSYQISEEIRERLDENGGEEFVLGIRPEDIRMTDDHPNAITTTVVVAEPMGDVTHLYVTIGSNQLTVTIDGDVLVQSGNEVSILFPEDHIHLFDATTGEAVKNSDVTLDEEASVVI